MIFSLEIREMSAIADRGFDSLPSFLLESGLMDDKMHNVKFHICFYMLCIFEGITRGMTERGAPFQRPLVLSVARKHKQTVASQKTATAEASNYYDIYHKSSLTSFLTSP